MIFFDKTRTIGQDANGKNVVWVSIYVDTAANLPTYNAYQTDGFILCMASEGRCIDTGDLYRIDSAGAWQISQAGTGTYTKAEIDALLNAKQDVLAFDATPTQNSTNPVTSGGIWTDQQRQETEIGVVANAGSKNVLKVTAKSGSAYGITREVSDDGTITLTTGQAQNNPTLVGVSSEIVIPKGNWILSGCPSGGGDSTYRVDVRISGTATVLAVDTGSGGNLELLSDTTCSVFIRVAYNYSVSDLVFKPMIRPASITDPTFQPYAKTNRELTVLTDEDRAALIELVDGGAKNVADMSKSTFTTNAKDGVTVTLSGDMITSTGTSGSLTNQFHRILYDAGKFLIPAGTWIVALIGTGTDAFRIEVNSSSYSDLVKGTYGNPVQITIPEADTESYARITQKPNTNCAGTFKLMICTPTAWKISKAYQQYRPSYQELYEMVLALQ